MSIHPTPPYNFAPRNLAFTDPLAHFPHVAAIDDEWKFTPAGRAICRALESRGLTGEHFLLVDDDEQALTLDWHPGVLGLEPTMVPRDADDPSASGISAALDACVAALAREAMMLQAGWRPGDPPPAWALEITDIADRVLRSAGADPFQVWDRAERDCEFAFELPRISDKAIIMRRHGHRLLTSQMEVAPGIVVEEQPGMTVRFADPAPLAPFAKINPGDRLAHPFDPPGASRAGATRDLEIGMILHDLAGGSVTLAVHAPLLTMAPVPEEALTGLRPRLLWFEVDGPIWWSVRRIERTGADPPGRGTGLIPTMLHHDA